MCQGVEGCCVNGAEAQRIPWRQQAVRCAVRVEKPEWGAPDELPPPRLSLGVDAGLEAGDTDRAGRHRRPRSGAAGQGERGIESAEISKAGREP